MSPPFGEKSRSILTAAKGFATDLERNAGGAIRACIRSELCRGALESRPPSHSVAFNAFRLATAGDDEPGTFFREGHCRRATAAGEGACDENYGFGHLSCPESLDESPTLRVGRGGQVKQDYE
jgi:hypothetical protein